MPPLALIAQNLDGATGSVNRLNTGLETLLISVTVTIGLYLAVRWLAKGAKGGFYGFATRVVAPTCAVFLFIGGAATLGTGLGDAGDGIANSIVGFIKDLA